jgi:hypothetical protein
MHHPLSILLYSDLSHYHFTDVMLSVQLDGLVTERMECGFYLPVLLKVTLGSAEQIAKSSLIMFISLRLL